MAAKHISMGTIVTIVMLLFLAFPVAAEELNLEGEGVIHYNYPENFKESNRYIRKGVPTKTGDCEFTTRKRLAPGQRIFIITLAYNPHTCESLVIEGMYDNKPKEEDELTSEQTIATEHMAMSSNSDWTVRAYLRTWYHDPIYLKVNSVTSQIWWDPTSNCAAGNYFKSQPDYDWLWQTGWRKIVGNDSPSYSCDSVSLNTTALYRSNAFPTCVVQRAPVSIRYNKNLVEGYADKTAEMEFTTFMTGPTVLCTNLLQEKHEFYVEKREIVVDGEIGCQGQPPALFINDLVLEDGDFDASASGTDYNGTPIYFDVNGSFVSNNIDLDIAMFSDSARTRHIRSDNCAGSWDGHTFYDGSCRLIKDTSAGCVPVWVQLRKNDEFSSTQSYLHQYEVDDTQTLFKQ